MILGIFQSCATTGAQALYSAANCAEIPVRALPRIAAASRTISGLRRLPHTRIIRITIYVAAIINLGLAHAFMPFRCVAIVYSVHYRQYTLISIYYRIRYTGINRN